MGFKVNLGNLSVSIGYDTSDFEKGKNEVNKGLKQTDKSLKDSLKSWAKWAAGLLAAGKAVSSFKNALRDTNEIKNLSFAANTLVRDFERGAFAARQFGIEQEKYGDILKDVNDRVGDFLITGAGPMVDFFEQIAPKVGVTAEQFKNLSGQQALGLYIQSLQKANLSQEEMTFFMEALASDSTRLIPLFADNARVFNELTQEAEMLGIGLENIDVARADLASKSLAKAGAFIDNTVRTISIKLAPAISAIVDMFTDSAKDVNDMGSAIDTAISGAVSVVGVLADGLHGIRVIFKGIEVVARAVIAGAVVGFDKLVQVLGDVANAIIDGLFWPFKKVLELMSSFSDTAKQALSQAEQFIDTIKIKGSDGMSEFADAQLAAMGIAADELHNLMMTPLPSDSIDQFIAESNEKFSQMAEENAAKMASSFANPGDPTNSGIDQSEQSESERIRQENQKILEALLEESAIREETLLGRIQREKEIVDAAEEAKRISADEAARAREEIARREAQVKNDILVSSLESAVQALSIGGKKAAKIQKVLAIKAALVKGKQAAVDAWEAGMSVGGPWAPVVAASYAAASIAKTTGLINSIRSGGKAGTGGGGAGVSPGSAIGNSQNSSSNGQQSNTQQPTDRRLTVALPGEGLLNTNQVRELIEQINEEAGNGFTIVTTGAS